MTVGMEISRRKAESGSLRGKMGIFNKKPRVDNSSVHRRDAEDAEDSQRGDRRSLFSSLSALPRRSLRLCGGLTGHWALGSYRQKSIFVLFALITSFASAALISDGATNQSPEISASQQNPAAPITPPVMTSPTGAAAVEQRSQGAQPGARLVASF